GVLHKSTPISEIINAIRRLHNGETLLSRAEIASLIHLARQQQAGDHAARQTLERLTPRERDVLHLLSEGLSDKNIAARLHVSKDTVHTHMVNLLGKLQVESRLQALIFAIRHGAATLN
ncbi:MAG: response regulator transcription factor, partial [Chloroflexota bacterium]|nr:response regulator transcription factor [Chloroflexota bacterium]